MTLLSQEQITQRTVEAQRNLSSPDRAVRKQAKRHLADMRWLERKGLDHQTGCVELMLRRHPIRRMLYALGVINIWV